MIKSVQFSSNRNTDVINNIIVAPSTKEKGSISIICGKNHSGKTYITKRIHRCIAQRNEALSSNYEQDITRKGVNNIYVEYLPKVKEINAILISRIGLITDLIKSVSVFSDNHHKSRKHLQQSDNMYRIQIKEALERFLFDCINVNKKIDSKKIVETKWFNPENIDYRTKVLNSIDLEKLYLTPRDNEVVRIFEELTQGKLYFGVNHRIIPPRGEMPEFELRLAFNGEIIIPVGGWSEGQKVLFALLSLIHYIKPDILIFDEIENHLHPEYISTLLDFLKKNIKQTIITTHHPHIIFSKHVDVVNYLEFVKTSDDLPDILDKKRSEKMKTMKLKNDVLDKNYSKLLSTYKLFDSYDNQLLRISTTSISDLNDLLVEIFTSLFNYEIAPPKYKKKPDLQSQKLFEIFEKRISEQRLDILEFGAGEGRLLIDIQKIVKNTERECITWSLYEPYEQPLKKLKANLSNLKFTQFINIYSEKPVSKFDFIIIPNVLHELTPDSIAEIMVYCSKSLKENGCILIVELFPLLKPEKYAVPLNRNEWNKLARSIGFKAISNGINFKNALHDAYFTQLYLPDIKGELKETQIRDIISDFWVKDVLPERIHSYDGHLRFGDVDEIPVSIGNLCTIASINAYQNKIWV